MPGFRLVNGAGSREPRKTYSESAENVQALRTPVSAKRYSRKKPTFGFTLWLSGPDPSGIRNLNRLYNAGCGDATFGTAPGGHYAHFDRRARSMTAAVTKAIQDVQHAVKGLKVVKVEFDEPDASILVALNHVLAIPRVLPKSKSDKKAILSLARDEVSLIDA